MKPSEFKKFTTNLGMELISTHCDIYTNFEKKIEEAAEVNLKYLICPWVGPQRTIDDYKKIAAIFNEKAKSWLERRTHKPEVPSSILGPATKILSSL